MAFLIEGPEAGTWLLILSLPRPAPCPLAKHLVSLCLISLSPSLHVKNSSGGPKWLSASSRQKRPQEEGQESGEREGQQVGRSSCFAQSEVREGLGLDLHRKNTKELVRLRLGTKVRRRCPQRAARPGAPAARASASHRWHLTLRTLPWGAVPRGAGCLAASFVSAYSPSRDNHKYFQTLPDLSKGGVGAQLRPSS